VGGALLILMIGLFLSNNPLLLALFLLALCLLYATFGYGLILTKCLLIFIPIGILTGAISILWKNDWLTGLASLERVIIMALSVIPLITTAPINLTRSMAQLKFPKFITLGILVTIRFVPILIGEIRRIREAMQTRGVNIAWYNITSYYRAFLIPFMIQLINISEILAISVETRAFTMTNKPTSIYKIIPFTLRDTIFLATLSVLCIMSIVGLIIL